MGIEKGDDYGGKGDGNGDGDKEGDGNQPQKHKKKMARERRRRQWRWGGQRHEGHGRSHNTWREGGDGGDGPWFVCEFWVSEEMTKMRIRECFLVEVMMPPP
jgi:hypothetical protein